jgi:hypothetical protein
MPSVKVKNGSILKDSGMVTKMGKIENNKTNPTMTRKA